MAITYTDNLGLPIVTDNDQAWGQAMRDAMTALDANPGIHPVADDVAMLALPVWQGRLVFRLDVMQLWLYSGTEWNAFLPASSEQQQDPIVFGGPMLTMTQEQTPLVLPTTSHLGSMPYEFFAGTGEQIMLLMLKVLPWADFIVVTDESKILTGTTFVQLNNKMARDVLVENVVVTDLAGTTTYVVDVDYIVALDETGYTQIRRIDLGSITSGQEVLIDYSYQPGVTGFRLRLYSQAAGGEILYEMDTDVNAAYLAGYEVRDPNFGYLPMCYYINADNLPNMHYEIRNYDAALSSSFIIDATYKPLT